MAKKNTPPEKGTDKNELVRNFFLKYYNSPAFEKNYRAGQAGWMSDDFTSVKNGLIEQVKKIQYKLTPQKGTAALGQTEYASSDNSVRLGTPDSYGNQDLESVSSHETAHAGNKTVVGGTPNHFLAMLNKNRLYKLILDKNIATLKAKPGDPGYDKPKMLEGQLRGDASQLTKDIESVRKYGEKNEKAPRIKELVNTLDRHKAQTMHDDAPSEVRADINSLRYLLAKNQIWDITSSNPGSFNEGMLNKLYQLKELNIPHTKSGTKYVSEKVPSSIKGVAEPKTPGLFLDRLRKRYKDEDIIWLINNIAKSGAQPNSDMA